LNGHAAADSAEPAPVPAEGRRGRVSVPSGVRQGEHYRLPDEMPFTAAERASTTILFGNLTPKHERLIQAVFNGNGYRFQNLPVPTKGAFQIGREYCNNGLCNPNYFTAGTLIEFLQKLEKEGKSPQQIVRDYVYFTLADCGPCRFGVYQSEYRQALENAGFPGFRVITFQSSRVITEGASEPGLAFNADIGFGSLAALILGDLFYQSIYSIRPYEKTPGATSRAFADCLDWVSDFLQNHERFEILRESPDWLARRMDPRSRATRILNTFCKYQRHLYGCEFRDLLSACSRRIDEVELDRLQAKPIVKVTGEFYSHLSESYANYNMFEFLESEGAQVDVDTITGHLLYWLHKSMLEQSERAGLHPPHPAARLWQPRKRLANYFSAVKKPLLLRLASSQYRRHYRRINRHLGGIGHEQLPQSKLVGLSQDYYHPLTRGGEGYLEVAKSIYYSRHRLCHMVLSLKPFGCMPSTQSDGVMATVTSHHPGIAFVSVETSGDADINALSRVQMALSDARRRADEELDRVLREGGVSLETVRDFVGTHPEMNRATFSVPHNGEYAGLAANLVVQVAKLLKRSGRR